MSFDSREIAKSAQYLRSQGFHLERRDGYLICLINGRSLYFDFDKALNQRTVNSIQRNGGEVFSVSSMSQVASIADSKANKR